MYKIDDVCYSRYYNGVHMYNLVICVDTVNDLPEPLEYWDSGTWVHVIADTDHIYRLGLDREWHSQSASE